MDLFFAMFSFCLAMSISPGPANMLILSSGVNYGVKKTMPFVLGAAIGFTSLLLFMGFGFFQIMNAFPNVSKWLSILGSLFIMYMGYKIALSEPTIEVNKKETVSKFYEGFFLQWLNPKAWIAAVSGTSIFSSTESYIPFIIFSSMYFFVCYASGMLWAMLGNQVAFLLKKPFRLRCFNISMGGLLILTAGYLLYTSPF